MQTTVGRFSWQCHWSMTLIVMNRSCFSDIFDVVRSFHVFSFSLLCCWSFLSTWLRLIVVAIFVDGHSVEFTFTCRHHVLRLLLLSWYSCILALCLFFPRCAVVKFPFLHWGFTTRSVYNSHFWLCRQPSHLTNTLFSTLFCFSLLAPQRFTLS